MFHIRNNHTSVRLIDRSLTGAYSNVTCSPVYVGVTLFSKPLTCLKHVPLRFKRPRSSQSGFKVCHIVTDVCRNHDSMGISSPTESALYACCRFGRGLHASTKEIPSEVNSFGARREPPSKCPFQLKRDCDREMIVARCRCHLNAQRQTMSAQSQRDLRDGKLKYIKDRGVYPVKRRKHRFIVPGCGRYIRWKKQDTMRPHRLDQLSLQRLSLCDELRGQRRVQLPNIFKQTEYDRRKCMGRTSKAPQDELFEQIRCLLSFEQCAKDRFFLRITEHGTPDLERLAQ